MGEWVYTMRMLGPPPGSESGFVQRFTPYAVIVFVYGIPLAAVFMGILYGIGLGAQRVARRYEVKPLTVAAALGWALLATLFFGVVPIFADIFSSFGAELPFPTALIIAHPRGVYGPVCLGLFVFCVVKDRYFQRRWLDRSLLLLSSGAFGLAVISLFTPMFGMG
jgi:hypothetical protein